MKIPKYFPTYIVALFLITLFLRIILINYYNNNLGGIELNVVYGIQRILLGQPLYQDPAIAPYAVIQYSPLYYYCTAGIAKLIGINGTDVQSVFVLCRIIALLFNLLTIGICALIIRSTGIGWLQSIVFSLPVLIVLTSHYYTRCDSMHLFLFVMAIWLYVQYSQKGVWQHIVIAALFSAGCMMAKQSGILCIGIISCCLVILEHKYFWAIIYSVCTFTFACLIAGLCIADCSRSVFYRNAYLGLKNGIDFSFLYTVFTSRYFLDLVPFYALGFIMASLAVKKISNKTYRILAVGAVLSWSFALVTGLKIGSSNNYFTEFLVFIIIAIPYLLHNVNGAKILFRARGHSVTVANYAIVALFILITSKTIGFFSAVFIEKSFKNNRQEYAREKSLKDYFEQRLKIKSGETIFFTERRFLDNLFIQYAIIPTKDVVTLVYNADPTTFNYTGFIAGMNNGLIRYIVTDEKRDNINVCGDSLPFIHFDNCKFKKVARLEGYAIYMYTPG